MVNQILRENTEKVIQDAVDVQLSKGYVRNAKAMLVAAIKEAEIFKKYLLT